MNPLSPKCIWALVRTQHKLIGWPPLLQEAGWNNVAVGLTFLCNGTQSSDDPKHAQSLIGGECRPHSPNLKESENWNSELITHIDELIGFKLTGAHLARFFHWNT